MMWFCTRMCVVLEVAAHRWHFQPHRWHQGFLCDCGLQDEKPFVEADAENVVMHPSMARSEMHPPAGDQPTLGNPASAGGKFADSYMWVALPACPPICLPTCCILALHTRSLLLLTPSAVARSLLSFVPPLNGCLDQVQPCVCNRVWLPLQAHAPGVHQGVC
jgi:hypothetical protein